jgi:hypothetical protein
MPEVQSTISDASASAFFAEKLLEPKDMPEAEKKFQTRYRKSPSFLSIHMGVKADVLPDDSDVHHMVLEVRAATLSSDMIALGAIGWTVSSLYLMLPRVPVWVITGFTFRSCYVALEHGLRLFSGSRRAIGLLLNLLSSIK